MGKNHKSQIINRIQEQGAQAPHQASRHLAGLGGLLWQIINSPFYFIDFIYLKVAKKSRRRFCAADLVTGQAMLILVMVLGATMLGVTTIAGYITLQKIRTATDIVDSTKSIYAADAGVEWCFYVKFGPSGNSTSTCDNVVEDTGPVFSNNSSVTVSDFGNSVRSIGNTNRAYRAFGIFLDEFNN